MQDDGFIRNAWYVAGLSEDFGPQLTPLTILGQQLVFFRRSDGTVAALEDACPHRKLPLSMGRLEGDRVVCGYHGLTFDVGQEIRMLAPGIAPTDRSIADLAWVPFFVKEPGQQGGEVSDADVTTYDVLPTIADVLDVDIPWDHLGRSAFDERTDGRTRTMHVTVQDEIFTLGPTVDVADADRDLLFEHGLDRFFPAVDDPLRWWKRGPYRDLVGTEVAASTGLEPLTVDLAPSSDPDDVDPSTDEVPGLVIGSVPDADPGDAVAVAVDGTIWATTEVWDSGGGPSVAAVVPFDAFVAGTNEVQVLSIEGP